MCITVSAARNGAQTVSRGWRDPGKLAREQRLEKSQASLGQCGRSKSREQTRQALCGDFNLVTVAGSAIPQFDANLEGGETCPESGIDGGNVLGGRLATGRRCRQKRYAKRAAEAPPVLQSVARHGLKPECDSSLLHSRQSSHRREGAARPDGERPHPSALRQAKPARSQVSARVRLPAQRFVPDSLLEGSGFDLSVKIRPEENCGFRGLAISAIVPQT